MKKVFSLILAAAMVLSLASVAFAATADTNDYILSAQAKNVYGATGYETELKYLDSRALHDAGSKLLFGKEYYYPIIANSATDASAVDVFGKIGYAAFAKQIGTLKVSAEWKEGGEYVDSVGIKTIYVTDDYNTTTDINRNIYVIYVKTTGSSADDENIVGTITVAGTAGAGAGKSQKIETKIAFDATIGKEEIVLLSNTDYASSTDSSAKFKFDANNNLELIANAKVMKDVKFDLEKVSAVKFDGDVVATLDTAAAKKLTISYNTNDVADIVAANPDAALMFYSIECNFKESVEVTIDPIDPEADNYLYQVLNSGATKDLTSFYSTDDEQFVLNQRKLTGTYIVSDMPLVF